MHQQLEQELAHLVGVEDALAFVSGNTANVSTIGHLCGKRDLVLYDECSHDSVLKGIMLSGADSYGFRHNSWQDLNHILENKRTAYEKVLVFIEGIYSMEGDIADLHGFIEVKQRHKAILMVDECLSIGVLGHRGRGIAEHCGIDPARVDIWMGGLSKALSSCGGYIAGSKALVNYLRYTAPGFIFTTGITPANSMAALASIRVLRKESWRVTRLKELSEFFLNRAIELGFNTGKSQGTPVIPIFFQNPQACMSIYKYLYHHRINVQPIFYPAVPPNASRLRFFVTCTHREEELEQTLRTLAEGVDFMQIAL
ncbi:MAG: hypothetical protein ETSY1_27485 [Candidatus Entotheonella factor]|uniref:Aminotransferase class I/classII large domain-containing protein n=1 Tax=Entotheonella factor TaxID=1429438 RepID=W4LFV7_ENTF1|nr:MAG: hypothetical protein ETSY1_27485 [Candidatus Entotheonella factor]